MCELYRWGWGINLQINFWFPSVGVHCKPNFSKALGEISYHYLQIEGHHISINIQPRNEEAYYGHSLKVGGNLLFQSTSF
jgi:hypothetical protein